MSAELRKPVLRSINGHNLLGFFGLMLISLIYFLLQDHLQFYAFNILTLIFVFACLALALQLAVTETARSSKGQANNSSYVLYLAYLMTILAFHFSLLPTFIIDERDIYFTLNSWYYDFDGVRGAYIAAVLFLIGYVAAGFFPQFWRRGSNPQTKKEKQALSEGWEYVFITLFLGTTWIVVFIFVLKITNYTQFYSLPAWALNLEIFLYPAIWASLFYGCTQSIRWRYILAAFAPWAAMAFFAGMRGPVLFPTLMTLAALQQQGRLKYNPLYVVVACVLVLYASSFVFYFRVGAQFDEALSLASPFRELAELGGSLRPVYDTAGWLSKGVDHLRFGATYWAPFERTYFLFLPFVERVSAVLDDRLTPGLMDQRSGAYGYSVVAEALLNFGYIGCALVGAGIGTFFRALGSSLRSGNIALIGASIGAGLFFHIRQGFVGAFGLAAIVFVTFLVLRSISSLWSKNRNSFSRGPARCKL